jgi:hypothetical protein
VEIDDRSAGAGDDLLGGAGDLAVLNEDGMVFEESGAGAVDDADVGEENLRGADFDELCDGGGEGRELRRG